PSAGWRRRGQAWYAILQPAGSLITTSWARLALISCVRAIRPMAAVVNAGFRAPACVQSWYLACRSAELRPGKVLSCDLAGTLVVVFRGRSGAIHALSAHCAHMGTHLGKAEVVGDCLRCPLHFWEYDGEGRCRRIPGREAIPAGARQRAYPVEE